MKQLAFCEYCMNESEYKVHKTKKISILNAEEINYKAKEVICNVCGNEIFVSDICDYNLMSLYNEYRKKYDIIDVDKIQQIKIKYSITEEALSLLLGWDNKTIERYLDGDMPKISNSDVLKKLYENPEYYSIILTANKERINPVDYSKSRRALDKIINENFPEEKIDAVIKYFLIRYEDFTPSAIQKLLYYTQAFYYVFTNDFIFREDCEAWEKGIVYPSVNERYERFGYETVNKNILVNTKLILENNERNIVESVIKFYGCYSGKILKEMTCNEAPWILTKTRIAEKNNIQENSFSKKIDKSLILKYFDEIKEKYDMKDLVDIKKYSLDLFNAIYI